MTVHPNFCSDIHCEQDMLGFDKYVDTLASMIRDKGFATPFCIGIYGKWGTGKTSFMHLLQNKLGEDGNPPHVVPVWFNPWRYEKEEHLIIAFLKTMEQSIDKFVESNESKKALSKLLPNLKTAIQRIGNAVSALAFGLKADFKLGPAGLEFDVAKTVAREEELTNKQMENAKKLSENLTSIYYDIVTELRGAVDQKAFLIAVFIDDLDRCLPEKAVELLEAIKLFLDLTGYLFIIGVAKEVVERGISYRYRFYEQSREKTDAEKEPVVAPDEYLEKMIQMPFELPPIEPGKNLEYIKSLLGDAEEYKEHVGIIGTGVGANPRSLKRFVNFLAFTSRLAETIKHGALEDRATLSSDVIEKGFLPVLYIKWAVIAFKFPKIHADIKANWHMLIELQEAARADSKPEDGEHEKAFQMPGRLRDVLKEGEPFPKDEWLITRFIHLTERTQIMAKDVDIGSVSKAHKPGDMVKVPKGGFLYGDEKEEREIDNDYWIDVFPVTNKQYQEFLSDPQHLDREVPYGERERAGPYNWDQEKRTFPEGRDDHPVVLVSHEDAKAFCQWRSKKVGKEYRLPTEEEWERAARGSDGRKYPWGDEFDKTKCNTEESGINETTPVTAYPEGASPHQCQDMAGNVWERTSSYYDKDQDTYVLRGGSWVLNRKDARCAYRFDFHPGTGSVSIGFRCVRTSK